MRHDLIILGLLLFLVAPAISPAQETEGKPMASVTPYLGGASWDDALESRTSLVYGIRGAYQATSHFAVEFGYNLSKPDVSTPSTVTTRKIRIWNLGITAGLKPRDQVNPYLVLGFNQMLYSAESGGSTESYNGFEVGIGLNFKLGGDQVSYRALRFEMRDAVIQFDYGNGDTNWANNLLFTLGVMFTGG